MQSYFSEKRKAKLFKKKTEKQRILHVPLFVKNHFVTYVIDLDGENIFYIDGFKPSIDPKKHQTQLCTM